ncbi:MAG: L-threonylcarbamoyladenylate synthase [Candidatus Paceibacterota bacterium]|jgi:L-threonylcarbamoyladenylate synthase
MNEIIKEIGQGLKLGKIGVIPTDTIYGIVCSALNKKSVKKLYKIRKRSLEKPMIILISSIKDLELFDVKIEKEIIKKYWPGKVSIIADYLGKNFTYLSRKEKSLAFRLPNNKLLINILKISGPLVAPSANTEGKKPAETIDQAIDYFGDIVDFYVDFGRLKSKPSKIITIKNKKIKIIRK